MTTDAGGAGEPRRRPAVPARPWAGWVVAGSFGAFFAALALLAAQVRAGEDPVLGPAAPQQQQRQVVRPQEDRSPASEPEPAAPLTTRSS